MVFSWGTHQPTCARAPEPQPWHFTWQNGARESVPGVPRTPQQRSRPPGLPARTYAPRRAGPAGWSTRAKCTHEGRGCRRQGQSRWPQGRGKGPVGKARSGYPSVGPRAAANPKPWPRPVPPHPGPPPVGASSLPPPSPGCPEDCPGGLPYLSFGSCPKRQNVTSSGRPGAPRRPPQAR